MEELSDDLPGRTIDTRDFDINPAIFPYYAYRLTSSINNHLTIGPYDRQRISKPIPIHFTHSSSVTPTELVAIGFTPVTDADPDANPPVPLKLFVANNIDNLQKDSITITLTSKTAGVEASTIGQPQNASFRRDGTTVIPASDGNFRVDVTAGSQAWVRRGDQTSSLLANELPKKGPTENPAYPYWSSAPQMGVDSKGITAGTEDQSRLGWLP